MRHIYARGYGLTLLVLGLFTTWLYAAGGGFTGSGPFPEPTRGQAIDLGLFFITIGAVLLIVDRFPLTGGFPTALRVESDGLTFSFPGRNVYRVEWSEKTYARVAVVAPPRVWDQAAGDFRSPKPGERIRSQFLFGIPASRFEVPGRAGVGCSFTITGPAVQAILKSAATSGLEVKELSRDDRWLYWRITGEEGRKITPTSFP